MTKILSGAVVALMSVALAAPAWSGGDRMGHGTDRGTSYQGTTPGSMPGTSTPGSASGGSISGALQQVEGQVQSVDANRLTLTDGTELTIPSSAQVERSQLQPGANVKASYEDRGNQKMVTSLEIQPVGSSGSSSTDRGTHPSTSSGSSSSDSSSSSATPGTSSIAQAPSTSPRSGSSSQTYPTTPGSSSGTSDRSGATQQVQGRIQSVNANTVTLTDGTVLVIPSSVQVERSELKPGANVSASYEDRGGQKVVTIIEIQTQR